MIALIILEYAVLASSFTLSKVVLGYTQPFFLIALRLSIAGLLLLGGYGLRSYYQSGKRGSIGSLLPDWAAIMLFIQAILFHGFFAFVPEFWALQYISSAKTCIMYGITPFVAAFFSFILYNERLSKQKIIGMSIGFAGLIPLIMRPDLGSHWSELFSISLPELVLLTAIIFASYAWFVVKQLMDKGYSLLIINGVAMLGGGILSGITSLIYERSAPVLVTNWPHFFFWLGFLIVISHGISYNLYGYLLKTHSITLVTLYGFLCPLFSTLFGWYFLNEQITWHHGLSLIMITCGLYLFTRRQSER